MGHLYHGYVSHNQRVALLVITSGYFPSKNTGLQLPVKARPWGPRVVRNGQSGAIEKSLWFIIPSLGNFNHPEVNKVNIEFTYGTCKHTLDGRNPPVILGGLSHGSPI